MTGIQEIHRYVSELSHNDKNSLIIYLLKQAEGRGDIHFNLGENTYTNWANECIKIIAFRDTLYVGGRIKLEIMDGMVYASVIEILPDGKLKILIDGWNNEVITNPEDGWEFQ